MAEGIIIERSARKTPRYARIDLRKYGEELRPFFESKGIQLTEEIKFTEKLKKSMWEADHGEWESRKLEDVLNI